MRIRWRIKVHYKRVFYHPAIILIDSATFWDSFTFYFNQPKHTIYGGRKSEIISKVTLAFLTISTLIGKLSRDVSVINLNSFRMLSLSFIIISTFFWMVPLSIDSCSKLNPYVSCFLSFFKKGFRLIQFHIYYSEKKSSSISFSHDKVSITRWAGELKAPVRAVNEIKG